MKQSNKIILIFGAPCSGKSTLSYSLGLRTGIKQVIDTDIIRAVKITQEPENKYINTYSFRSWKFFGKQTKRNLIKGLKLYSSQIEKEILGVININNNIQRNIIIEGVHLHPDLLAKIKDAPNIYPICISISPKQHKRNLDNRIKRDNHKNIYLKSFKSLRAINNYLKEFALRNNIPVINNNDYNKTIIELSNRVGGNMINGVMAVLYKKQMGQIRYALFKRKENWSGYEFLKGSLEEGETPRQALLREIKEEAGISINRIKKTSHIVEFNNGDKIIRLKVFYVKVPNNSQIKISSEHSEAGWYDFSTTFNRLSFENLRELLTTARVELKDDS